MLKTGVLLINTGTPDAPTPRAVRRYLREFLSDKRIVQLPRAVWLPILYGAILPLRPKRSAKLYQNIWTDAGSPMRAMMQTCAQKLAKHLQMPVEIGMNYGNPSIKTALHRLQEALVDRIIVLPLFPQYSNTTTASSHDRFIKQIKHWKTVPESIFIREYAQHEHYIQALATSIRDYWQRQGRTSQHLLMSFHGIPERFVKAGDPYAMQCEETANLLADELELRQHEWTLCYQSQFGYDKWLKPSTQALFDSLPSQGIESIDVVCPGFSFDCLETLEEIAITGEEAFHAAGGKQLRYIPCLNDSDLQIMALTGILKNYV